MGKLKRWETVYVRKTNGEYTTAAAVGVHEPLAISATPHEPAVAAAPNPGEYTGKLPVGEYTELLPVGERTQLVGRAAVEPVELKSEGLLSGSRSDPPLFLEVKVKVDPWKTELPEVEPSALLDDYDKAVAELLADYDRQAYALFADVNSRYPMPRKAVTAS
jgi:hypothetical protein